MNGEKTYAVQESASCAGSGCRRAGAAGRFPRQAAPGLRLCTGCLNSLVAELRQLPSLYEECGLRLSGSGLPRERTSGGPLPGMPFNAAAAEARSAILGLLRSWTGVVVEERRLGTPRDTVSLLSATLVRHADWLAAHSAAGDVSAEVAQLVRRSRRVIDPEPLRRVAIGTCVEADCSSGLTALVRPQQSQRQAEIVCDGNPSHRWFGHEWLQLSRLLARKPQSTGTEPPAEAPSHAPRWISAGAIARMWGMAPGSVYRHASEQQWRRLSRAGRTYYHDADVHCTLSRRTPAA